MLWRKNETRFNDDQKKYALAIANYKLFNLDKHYISRSYYKFIGQYKIAILVFNIVPYLALSIMNVMY